MPPDQRLIAVGISHHTASVEQRETLSISPDAVPVLLKRLREDGISNEALLLSTCNRTELYTVPGSLGTVDKLARWLMETGGVTERSISELVYRKWDEAALHHIFRVASSLDSLVLGEPQIVGQLKTAFRVAQDCNAAGPVLHRVMDQAMNVSKRVRTETEISREATSVGRAGVELARQVLGHLKGRSALLVGAGDHGKVVLRSLQDFGLTEIVVANRTFGNAAALASDFNGSAIPLQEVDRFLGRVDVVIASTNAGKVLLNREDVASSLSARRGRSLVMIDLSVPRNIDPSVNDLSGVYRFDIDDLAKLAGRGKQARQNAAAIAEEIVEEETSRHWRRLMGEQVNQQIGGIVQAAESVRLSELSRAGTVLGDLTETQQDAVDAMTKAIVKKILHQPLSMARGYAEDGDVQKAIELFNAFNKGNASDD